jgi:hypothetical protein
MQVRDEADRGGFNEEEEELLRIVSAQASVVLMNCRNFEAQREKRGESGFVETNSAQEYLRENGMKISGLNINDFVYALCSLACSLLSALCYPLSTIHYTLSALSQHSHSTLFSYTLKQVAMHELIGTGSYGIA